MVIEAKAKIGQHERPALQGPAEEEVKGMALGLIGFYIHNWA